MTGHEVHFAPAANLGIFEVVVVEGVFSLETCAEIRSRAGALAWQPEGPLEGHGDATWVAQPLPTLADQSPIPELTQAVSELNASRFRIEATELAGHDPPRLARYPAGCPGRPPKLGLVDGFWTRKLGFVVALDQPEDASGGQLHIAGGEYAPPLGSMIVFTALQRYGVTAVGAGRREVLEGWVHGPAWV